MNYKIKLNLYRELILWHLRIQSRKEKQGVCLSALPFPVSPSGSGLSWRLAQPLGLPEEALRLVRQLEMNWDAGPTGRHTAKLETRTARGQLCQIPIALVLCHSIVLRDFQLCGPYGAPGNEDFPGPSGWQGHSR